jgi:hypothetical protein
MDQKKTAGNAGGSGLLWLFFTFASRIIFILLPSSLLKTGIASSPFGRVTFHWDYFR